MKRQEPTPNLSCPVCFEDMKAPIYLCEKGHSLCGKCTPNVKDICPTCRGKMTTARNFTLESMLGESPDSLPAIPVKVNTPKLPQCQCPICNESIDKTHKSIEEHFKTRHDETVTSVIIDPPNNVSYKMLFSADPEENDVSWNRKIILSKGQFSAVNAKTKSGNLHYRINQFKPTETAHISISLQMTKNARKYIRGFTWKGNIYPPDVKEPMIIIPQHQLKDLEYNIQITLKFEK